MHRVLGESALVERVRGGHQRLSTTGFRGIDDGGRQGNDLPVSADFRAAI
jgi:hypothetical protein